MSISVRETRGKEEEVNKFFEYRKYYFDYSCPLHHGEDKYKKFTIMVNYPLKSTYGEYIYAENLSISEVYFFYVGVLAGFNDLAKNETIYKVRIKNL